MPQRASRSDDAEALATASARRRRVSTSLVAALTTTLLMVAPEARAAGPDAGPVPAARAGTPTPPRGSAGAGVGVPATPLRKKTLAEALRERDGPAARSAPSPRPFQRDGAEVLADRMGAV